MMFKFRKVRNKEEARQLAIDFQSWASDQDLSWGEYSEYQGMIYEMARKYGLVREFKENGVL